MSVRLKIITFLKALMLLVVALNTVICVTNAPYFVMHDPHTFYEEFSSGETKTTSVSTQALVLLDEISLKTGIVCASSMNIDTMRETQRHFPMINWWIVEDGHRIFSRKLDSNGKNIISEDESYTMHLNGCTLQDDYTALSNFENELRGDGYVIESEGYHSMFRVLSTPPTPRLNLCKIQERDPNDCTENASQYMNDTEQDLKETLRSVEDRLPSQLIATHNKGDLVIQVRGLGKQASIEWLTKKLATKFGSSEEYMFMGSDDNDISAAQKAVHTFIAVPASIQMQAWFDNNKPSKATSASEDSYAANAELLQSVLDKL